jgi:Zn-dependent oligopeptidase
MNNPLLEKSDQPYGTIPFNEIKPSHFVPAVKSGIEDAESTIEEISNNKEAANFENTILALELSGGRLDTTMTAYYHLFGSESDQNFKDLADQINPMVAEFENNIYLNKKLYKRIESVFQNKNILNDSEDLRLLDIIFKDFVRNGAGLSDNDKIKLREIDKELSTLSPQFSKNTLNATNEFELWLNEDQLEGLPDTSVEAAKLAAKERGKDDKWLITGQFPSFSPFIKYSIHRELRKEVHIAVSSKCNGGNYDNNELCSKISKIKHKRAQLLGYDNYAHYILEERMAEKQDKIYNLLDNLYESCIEHAKRDLKEISNIAKDLDGIDHIKSWDIVYYSEKLKKKLFNFDENELKNYFQSEKVMEGAFEVAKRLYGLKFNSLNNIQTWHKDVNVYEVTEEDGNHVGILYEDLFPRNTKKGGAWMNPLRSQGMVNKKVLRPHISLTCNLTKPTGEKPSLLTMPEVKTIFHEFGHCLHGLLSNVKYRKISGTSVFWDFVELPSQIMENWVSEKEALELFAYHYKTGEVLPDDLLMKITKSKNFMSGTNCLRQLTFGYLDMAWFGDDNNVKNVAAFENKAIKKTLLREVDTPSASISTQLGHIFAGGYSAGYYSYKWAEVLDADAFEKFKEDGIFNKETARSFRDNILSKGNIKHPLELYKSFRGRDPEVKALLKREGLS